MPQGRVKGEQASNLIKTAFQPYDLAEIVFLLIAKHHLGRELSVDTDGEPAYWKDAAELCKRELGYASDVVIEEEGRLLLHDQCTASGSSPTAETGGSPCT